MSGLLTEEAYRLKLIVERRLLEEQERRIREPVTITLQTEPQCIMDLITKEDAAAFITNLRTKFVESIVEAGAKTVEKVEMGRTGADQMFVHFVVTCTV